MTMKAPLHVFPQDNVDSSSGSGTGVSPVNLSAMRVHKTTLMLVVLLAALAVWIPQQHRLAQARLDLAEAEAQRAQLDERIATVTAALESVRRELRAQQTNRAGTLAAVAKAEQELEQVDPESRWADPPATLPAWNAESPYVWLHKEKLPKVQLSAFNDKGELRGEVAAVLTATEIQQRTLNTTLPRLLAEYRALEAANAERVAQSVPGIDGDGLNVTLRITPMPEEGARFKQQFETALRNELGEQRANLLMQLSERRLNDLFSFFGAKPPVISVTRHPNGTYDINIQFGSWGLSGPMTIAEIHDKIPPHLLPLFSDVLSPTDSADRAGPPEN